MNSGRRRARPLERGIEWLPRHDAHYILAGMMVSARAAPPICILQDTLWELDERLRAASDFAFGLLAGSLCVCKDSGRTYTLIEGFVPCEIPGDAQGDDPYGLMALAMRQQIVLLERTGTSALGLYLCDTTVLPEVALEDVGLFRSVFTQPWNMMLIRDQGPDGDLGAFVRVEPIDDQAFAAPFTELIPERGRRNHPELPPSVVRWVNYQPTEPVAATTGVHRTPSDSRDGHSARWPAGSPQTFGLKRASNALSPVFASVAARFRRLDAGFTAVVDRLSSGRAAAETGQPAAAAHTSGARSATDEIDTTEMALPRIGAGRSASAPKPAVAPAQDASAVVENPGAPPASSTSEVTPAEEVPPPAESQASQDAPDLHVVNAAPDPTDSPGARADQSSLAVQDRLVPQEVHTEPAEPAEPADAEPADAEPAESAESAEPDESAESAEPDESAEPGAQSAPPPSTHPRDAPHYGSEGPGAVEGTEGSSSPKAASARQTHSVSSAPVVQVEGRGSAPPADADGAIEKTDSRLQALARSTSTPNRSAEAVAQWDNRSELFEVLMMPPEEEDGGAIARQRYLRIGAVVLIGMLAVAAVIITRM